jgi:uncharacterized protein YjiS (DUF1127 family)
MTYQNIETLITNRPLPPVAAVVFALAVTVLQWEQRQHSRRALKRPDAHMLKDIGLSRMDAMAEGAKPFGRPENQP